MNIFPLTFGVNKNARLGCVLRATAKPFAAAAAGVLRRTSLLARVCKTASRTISLSERSTGFASTHGTCEGHGINSNVAHAVPGLTPGMDEPLVVGLNAKGRALAKGDISELAGCR